MIRYTASLQGITPDQLSGRFFVGWTHIPSPETHLHILRQSAHAVIALDEREQVVGFITAISDGVLSAYIPLLEVLKSHQRMGIGKQLVFRMIEELKGLYMIDLCCDAELEGYYAQLGMTATCGMIRRDRRALQDLMAK